MQNVFIDSDNIFSPLGLTTAENLLNLENNISGIREINNVAISDVPFFASLFTTDAILQLKGFTLFENLLISSISSALESTDVRLGDKKTILILSTTKGNISLLENDSENTDLFQQVALHKSAEVLSAHFKTANTPIIISNACISGLLALITGMRLIQSGLYDHAVVAGADVISKFVLSGFQSFQALSGSPCKPFDKNRNGINLGEGAATVILTAKSPGNKGIRLLGGATSNDANHISGPSRSGEELAIAIRKAMIQANVQPAEVDFISAHGTATIYNDEMESKAISLSKLSDVPVNSLKGYYGHTLGAAGLIEAVISVSSLKNSVIYPTLGYKTSGVSCPLNISDKLRTANLKTVLKTASGFGGCNAAIVMSNN